MTDKLKEAIELVRERFDVDANTHMEFRPALGKLSSWGKLTAEHLELLITEAQRAATLERKLECGVKHIEDMADNFGNEYSHAYAMRDKALAEIAANETQRE